MSLLPGPPPLPREHGTWAMLALPILFGLAAAWPPAATAWLLVPALALLFLARDAAAVAANRLVGGKATAEGFLARRFLWAALYAGAAIVFGLAAARFAGRVRWPAGAPRALLVAAGATLLLGALHSLLALARRDRTMAGEIAGMLGLASTAPLVMAASGRPLDGRLFGALCVPFLYSLSSLAYVRAVRGFWKENPRPGRAGIVAHLLIAAAVARLHALGWIPIGMPLAYLPVFARTAWGYYRPPPSLRALGWREVWVASAFGVVAIAAWVV